MRAFPWRYYWPIHGIATAAVGAGRGWQAAVRYGVEGPVWMVVVIVAWNAWNSGGDSPGGHGGNA